MKTRYPVIFCNINREKPVHNQYKINYSMIRQQNVCGEATTQGIAESSICKM